MFRWETLETKGPWISGKHIFRYSTYFCKVEEYPISFRLTLTSFCPKSGSDENWLLISLEIWDKSIRNETTLKI